MYCRLQSTTGGEGDEYKRVDYGSVVQASKVYDERKHDP